MTTPTTKMLCAATLLALTSTGAAQETPCSVWNAEKTKCLILGGESGTSDPEKKTKDAGKKADGQGPWLGGLMSDADFKAAGLMKLTPAELAALEAWTLRLLTTAFQVGARERTSSSSPAPAVPSRPSPTRRGYRVEASANDEAFIVNGQVFKAQTYCMNVEQGDEVIFTDSAAAFGACAEATFVDLRTGDACKVWCE